PARGGGPAGRRDPAPARGGRRGPHEVLAGHRVHPHAPALDRRARPRGASGPDRPGRDRGGRLMATSQNGWTVFTSGTDRAMVVSPWVTGRIRGGSAAVVLNYVAQRFNAEVEPIVRAHSWGWAYRSIRGATSGYSNHASGTAEDFNAPKHALGKRGTFTPAQVRAIRSILVDCGGVVRWGGDYTSRADEMHFEINASPAA